MPETESRAGGEQRDRGEGYRSEDREELIDARTVDWRHKRFFVDLKRNRHGIFVKLTESSHAGRYTIRISSESLGDIICALQELQQVSEGMEGGGR